MKVLNNYKKWALFTSVGGKTMKKIALIADGWRKFITYAWVDGCQQYIKEHHIDADIYYFHSFGNFSKDEKYNIGEYNIINLPDLTKFDGIIFEFSSVTHREVKEKMIQKVREAGVPTISLEEDLEGLYYAGIDNYAPMEQMVEHLVSEHGCKDLFFIGGPEINGENQIRQQAFVDVLKRHGLPCGEDRIFNESYEIDTGKNGFLHFYKQGRIPDAFVCANDNIAVGVCYYAKDFGYKVPDDFYVTGFDNFDKAAVFSPRLSTVGFRREDIAYRAMKLLHEVWEGTNTQRYTFAPTTCILQDSCGCKAKHPVDRGDYAVGRIMMDSLMNRIQNETLELKRELINASTFEEFADRLEERFHLLANSRTVIMLDRNIMECSGHSGLEKEVEQSYRVEGYPEDMHVLFACEDGVRQRGLVRRPGELHPAGSKKGYGNIFMYMPLHFRDQEVGYVVMENCNYMMDNQIVFEIMSVLQESMENMYHRLLLRRINDELSELSMLDSLTGLYNRMAYNRRALPMFEKQKKEKKELAILFVDADRLKYINDNFGHDMGNIAICTVSNAILHNIPKDSVAMRYGGDEFVVLIPNVQKEQVEQISKNIRETIHKSAQNQVVEFPISASIGYAMATPEMETLNDCINLADEQMYQDKKARHMERRC